MLLGPEVVPPAPQGLLPGVQTGLSGQERWLGCLCMSLPPVMETLVFWPGGFGRVPPGAGCQQDSRCEPAQSPRVHPHLVQGCQEGQHQQQRSAWQDARSLGAHTRGKCRQGGGGWTPSPQSCSQVRSAVRTQSPDSQKVDSCPLLWSTEYRPSTGAWI